MDDGAEGVDVAFWGVPGQFGRLPVSGAGRVVSGEVEGRVAKVCEDDVGVVGGGVWVEAEEDVAGFDVAVADASAGGVGAPGVEASVEEFERRGELLVDLPDEGFWEEGVVSSVLID